MNCFLNRVKDITHIQTISHFTLDSGITVRNKLFLKILVDNIKYKSISFSENKKSRLKISRLIVNEWPILISINDDAMLCILYSVNIHSIYTIYIHWVHNVNIIIKY